MVRKTNPRAIEQSEKFHVKQGIHRSSVSRIIHKDVHLKCCRPTVLHEKARSTADWSSEAHSMHALFSMCSLRDDNVITSKPTWKLKRVNSILKSLEYFCQISPKLINIIPSYIPFQFGSFLRHSLHCRRVVLWDCDRFKDVTVIGRCSVVDRPQWRRTLVSSRHN